MSGASRPPTERRRAQVAATQARVRRRERQRVAIWTALAIGAAALGAVAYLAFGRDEATAPERPPAIAFEDIGCSQMEQLAYHVHAHLAIFVDGQAVTVPANIGIREDCIVWLHTHDTSGILHVEAPEPRTYTLGAFFQIWGQPLDATHLLDRQADDQHQIRAYVNGEPYTGPPQDIPLDPRAVIVLEYGPPFVDLPPFDFPPGL